jgi:uncharacterized protein (UPF0332 family)
LLTKFWTKYEKRIKSIVLFGDLEDISVKAGDIDVFMILDDTIPLFSEEEEKIEEDIEKTAEVSTKISVQLHKLTEFWDYARVGHPLIYRVIKTGILVYDTGFFAPVKRLLELGKIPLTREQIDNLMEGASGKLARAKAVKLLMLAEDCYYAMLNTAQAVLMFIDIEPPPPSRAYAEIRKNLVEHSLLKPEYAEWLKEIVEIRKKIERKELVNVSGKYVDEWLDKAEKFVNEMYGLFSAIEKSKKEKIIQRTYEVMYKAAKNALETINKLPEKKEEISQVFKEEFVDKKLIADYYEKIWACVEEMKELANRKEADKLSYDYVLRMREEVRKLIHDLSGVLKKKEQTL